MASMIFAQKDQSREEWIVRVFRQAIQMAHSKHAVVSIVVPAKKHTVTTPIKFIFGEEILGNLEKGEIVKVDGIDCRLISPTSKESHTKPPVLVVVSARKEHIQRIQNLPNVIEELIMPYQEQDEEAWSLAINKL